MLYMYLRPCANAAYVSNSLKRVSETSTMQIRSACRDQRNMINNTCNHMTSPTSDKCIYDRLTVTGSEMAIQQIETKTHY